MAIKTISVTAIPMIFRLIDSRIMVNRSPQTLEILKHIRDVAAAISAIDRGDRLARRNWSAMQASAGESHSPGSAVM
jgi:hypothetical protein